MKKKKIKLLILSILISSILLILGVTYAYFSAQVNGSETSSTITLEGGYIDIVFDGGANITVSGVFPQAASVAQKDFTLTATNSTTATMSYGLNLVVDSNTFSDDELSFTLLSNNTSSNGSVVPEITSNESLATGESSTYLGKGTFVGQVDNAVHSYSLYIYFLDNGTDQNGEQGHQLQAHVSITSLGTGTPSEGESTEVTTDTGDGGATSTYEEPTNNYNEDQTEIALTVYSVAYVTDSSASSLNYTINLNNLPSNVGALTIGSSSVMSSLSDFNSYIKLKNVSGISLVGGNSNYSISASAAEYLAHSGTSDNIAINSISVGSCTSSSCQINISEGLSNLSNVTPHNTLTVGGSSVSAIYIPIKFTVTITLFGSPDGWKTASSNTLLGSLRDDNTLSLPLTSLGTIATIENDQNYGTVNEAVMSATYDDYGTSYYFRGFIHDNFVVFANMCWRVVRVTGNGAVKLTLYNSNPNNVVNPCDSSEYSYERSFAEYTTNTYTSAFNSKYYDNAGIGYMYGDVWGQYTSSSSISIGTTWPYYYATSYTYDSDTNQFSLSGTTYSGNWSNSTTRANIFATYQYTCHSTSASGTCSTLYRITGYVNSTYASGYKIYYASSSYDSAVNNNGASTILTNLYTWYENKLLAYTPYLSDVIWCGDKSIVSGVGYGSNTTYYGAYNRNLYSTGSTATLVCPDVTGYTNISKYTAFDTTNGNGDLYYPIGLLTADEVVYAANGYLYPGGYQNWWTMTPAIFNNSAYVYYIDGWYGNIQTDSSSNNLAIRPAIALQPTTKVTGSGTSTDPYVVASGSTMTINFYKSGTLQGSNSYTVQVGDVLNEEDILQLASYNTYGLGGGCTTYSSMDKTSLTISSNASNNTVNVYYVSQVC